MILILQYFGWILTLIAMCNMKSFIKSLGKKANEVGALLSTKAPAVKSKLVDLGHTANDHASAAKVVIEKRSNQALLKAQEIIESPQAQAMSKSINSGINQLKVTVDKTLYSMISSEEKSTTTESPSDEESKLKNAIAKLDGRDKLGVAAEVMSVAGGAAAGAAAAGTIAGAAGATTLFGSTGLASLLGGVFTVSTPVGWVIGSAVVAGAAGYGLMKFARSGAKQDVARRELIERLTNRLSNLSSPDDECQTQTKELQHLLALTMALQLISDSQGDRMIALVESGALKPELAISRLKSLARSAGALKQNTVT